MPNNDWLFIQRDGQRRDDGALFARVVVIYSNETSARISNSVTNRFWILHLHPRNELDVQRTFLRPGEGNWHHHAPFRACRIFQAPKNWTKPVFTPFTPVPSVSGATVTARSNPTNYAYDFGENCQSSSFRPKEVSDAARFPLPAAEIEYFHKKRPPTPWMTTTITVARAEPETKRTISMKIASLPHFDPRRSATPLDFRCGQRKSSFSTKNGLWGYQN